jgi:hypothetical protein
MQSEMKSSHGLKYVHTPVCVSGQNIVPQKGSKITRREGSVLYKTQFDVCVCLYLVASVV